MKHTAVCRLVAATVLFAVAMAPPARAAGDQAFEVRLGLLRGHIPEVYLGCAEGGTSGYDRGLDDMAPPKGPNGRFSALTPPGGNLALYRDVRGPADRIEWVLTVAVPDEPVQVSWDPATLPEGFEFTVTPTPSAVGSSMRDVTEATLEQDGTLTVVAARVAEAAPDEKPEAGLDTAVGPDVPGSLPTPGEAPATSTVDYKPLLVGMGFVLVIVVVLLVYLGVNGRSRDGDGR
jgi:hypothetical protein